jgi:hypothetical protein
MFNVPSFKIFPYLVLNYNNPKLVVLVLNYPYLIFSPVLYKTPLLPEKSFNEGFTVFAIGDLVNSLTCYLRVFACNLLRACRGYEIK